jgi:hypothetical protein
LIFVRKESSYILWGSGLEHLREHKVSKVVDIVVDCFG